MQRIVLLGDPVAHSRSPAFQNAALAHLGIAARYEVWHTPAAELPARVAALREPAVVGANVTLPHKTAVMPLLDDIEAEAAQIGAVNTIYKRPDGALIGTNTDAPALLEALRAEGGFTPEGRHVVMLGASGAARAAAYALVNAGVARLVVANRTLERAEELLGDILAYYWEAADTAGQESTPHAFPDGRLPVAWRYPPPRLIALTLDDPDLADYLADSALLLNATSLGWHADETPLPDPPVPAGMLVYDMVYRPTRLLQDTAARGARTLDGMGMLLRQGALAFTRWTGQPAPLEVMQAALRAA
ncbi:MAG: shikimate dehydrogenase family protein [Chloroflexaceae bacterium]